MEEISQVKIRGFPLAWRNYSQTIFYSSTQYYLCRIISNVITCIDVLVILNVEVT